MIHCTGHGKIDLKTGACDHAPSRQHVAGERNISTRSIASILHPRFLRHFRLFDIIGFGQKRGLLIMRKNFVSVALLEFRKFKGQAMHLWVLVESMLSCIGV